MRLLAFVPFIAFIALALATFQLFASSPSPLLQIAGALFLWLAWTAAKRLARRVSRH